MSDVGANGDSLHCHVRFQVGDAVHLRVPQTDNPRRSYFLKDARVESVSSCGRYVRVSGVRPWGNHRHTFTVAAKTVSKSNTSISEVEEKGR